MNLRNIKIRILLIAGLGLMLLMAFITGIIAYNQSRLIHEQTELIYNHPFKVRRAIGHLTTDIVSIQRDVRNLMLFDDHDVVSENLIQIMHAREDAARQIEILELHYLGPKSDVDSLKEAFSRWNATRDEKIGIILNTDSGRTQNSLQVLNALNRDVGVVFHFIGDIDTFAKNKADQLYEDSQILSRKLNIRLVIVIIISMLVSIIIFNILIRNIRQPLDELSSATQQFREGNYRIRSQYHSSNEFGLLSGAFNDMADYLESIIILNQKTEQIERLMLAENDPRLFFRTIMTRLCESTGAQIATVYLYNKPSQTFDLFESIGLEEPARKSFPAEALEGDIGLAVTTRKVQHITHIPGDTPMRFPAAGGMITPREIITAPVAVGDDVIAVISLATIKNFSKQDSELVKEILAALSARIEGILSYQKVRELSAKLEIQNQELEMQKKELMTQSTILGRQNTELETQKQHLAEASRLKTNFLSNMSHELRTPLNSVIALTGVLNRRLEGKIPAEEHSYLEVIERNGKNLLALINDILDISRIESGRVEMECTDFNLTELISGIVSMIAPQASQKNITIDFAPEKESMVIHSDAGKIYHILQNIISNAVKFTDKGGVHISTSQPDDKVNITIKDTGIGIAEEHLPYIFDEFRQGDSSTSKRYGGTGLGLALAKKYADLINGKINVQSQVGKGSDFTLSVPVHLSTGEESGPFDYSAGNPYHLKKTAGTPDSPELAGSIMLIEDSEPAIIQIQDVLSQQGFNVIVARDGDEALERMNSFTPDAIILDLMMPGKSGFDVLQAVRESEKTAYVPVLILTAKIVTKEELGFLKKNNIHQLIRKGDIDLQSLVSHVRSMIKPSREKLY